MTDIERRAIIDASGLTKSELYKELAEGHRRRIYYGAYTDVPPGEEWEEYVLRVLGAALNLRGGSVFSHDSAAALHGIGLLAPDHRRVHATVERVRGGGRTGPRFVHPRPLRSEDITHIDNIPVTTRARTAVDIAQRGSFAQALTVFDAVRLEKRVLEPWDPEPVTVDELQDCLDFLGRREGVAIARRALAASTTQSESVGESWSRAMMIEWKLPAPVLQAPFRYDEDQYYSDFRWRSLIGEFDGQGKYLLDPERKAHEAERDARLRKCGFTVVHWDWDELQDRREFFMKLTDEMLDAGVIPAPLVFPG